MIRSAAFMSTAAISMVNSTWVERDLRHVWHPCSQMKDYEQFPPIEILSAKGMYLQAADGCRLMDAISSWWCKSLGHGHPKVMEAVQRQLSQFEHIIGANTCQKPLVQLSELLCDLIPHTDKVFFSGDGSCAVEIALKMSLHAHAIQGHSKRTRFLALKNGYHGETGATLSVSDLGIYKDPYQPIITPQYFINPVYVHHKSDPLWHDCSTQWPAIEAQLNSIADELAAVIFEPIIQGAGGMKVISADFLNRLSQWAQAQGIFVIADEIMTGIGRTGKWTASEHARIYPDFVCLSKGLTSGFCAFSTVSITQSVFDLFYDDYDKNKNFLHSQTYSGNALGAAAAVATLQTIQQEQLMDYTHTLEAQLWENMRELESDGLVKNIRGVGAVVAADLQTEDKRAGFEVFKQATQLGALLRPLGNTVYWIPAFIATESDLNLLKDITAQAIQKVLK